MWIESAEMLRCGQRRRVYSAQSSAGHQSCYCVTRYGATGYFCTGQQRVRLTQPLKEEVRGPLKPVGSPWIPAGPSDRRPPEWWANIVRRKPQQSHSQSHNSAQGLCLLLIQKGKQKKKKQHLPPAAGKKTSYWRFKKKKGASSEKPQTSL